MPGATETQTETSMADDTVVSPFKACVPNGQETPLSGLGAKSGPEHDPGQQMDARSVAHERRTKDPYRHVLPRKMSFQTTGVLATFLRPLSGRRRAGTVSPTITNHEDLGSRTRAPMKRGSSQRKVSNPQNAVRRKVRLSLEPEPIQKRTTIEKGTDGTTTNPAISFETGRWFHMRMGRESEVFCV